MIDLREEMILSRSLKMERMLTLLEIADDSCGKRVAAGFKPRQVITNSSLIARFLIRPERNRGSMTERDGSVGQSG